MGLTSHLLRLAARITGKAIELFAKVITRDAGLRASSHLIPGQGGFLDQIASVIFAAPVLFHLTLAGWH